ncbi:hypothetical protein [Halolamina sp.]|jgi:hypothetical protein|uniref:DUF7263 family protein n=1 Tax=Halolamina sp. TaxID=1940283 RepID=UPI000223BCDC|nr:hypothetical protein Halar_3137 [halophilic archaeon DL31]
MSPNSRGQANLASLAIALVALVSATTLGLVVADGALANADREPLERRAAVAAADRVVTAPGTTVRPNVLDREAMQTVGGGALDDLAPPVEGRAVRLRLDDETLFERGDPIGGTTVQRIVLVAESTTRTRTVTVEDGGSHTLPRRTTHVELVFATDSTVETVRLNGRVVLHDPDGLRGRFSVRASRYETATLAFEGGSGDVEIVSYPLQTRKATLRVTVDD